MRFQRRRELRSVKGEDQSSVRWLRWNHLARVTVSDEIPGARAALAYLRARTSKADALASIRRWQTGWGMSGRYRGEAPRILWVQLDGDAGTQIIEHGVSRIGRDLPFLEADVTSAAHELQRGALHSAFVIGGGGGRDCSPRCTSALRACAWPS